MTDIDLPTLEADLKRRLAGEVRFDNGYRALYAADASMPDDGKTIFFACADATTYVVKIMYSLKQADGTWGTATPVD